MDRHQEGIEANNEYDECGWENNEFKIVGGEEAREHQFPWMVATEVDGFIFCGATLISMGLVLMFLFQCHCES